MELAIIGVTVLLGLYMAWTIGANDFANSMGSAVGAGALTLRWAVILGALCELAGSVLVGAHVTDTVRKGIVDPADFAGMPEQLALGMICALLACALWLHLATWWGMPVSTTHAIVGAVAGFGVVAVGLAAVDWAKMGGIVASWFVSPVAGGVLAYALFRMLSRAVLGRRQPVAAAIRLTPLVVAIVITVVAFSAIHDGLDRLLPGWVAAGWRALGLAAATGCLAASGSSFFIARYLRGRENAGLDEQLRCVERVFAPLVVVSSCSVAFAHGANDVANAIGPVAAVVDILRSGTVQMQVRVPLWILGLGGVGIVLGLATYGQRVLRTVGSSITHLTPSRGVAADLAVAATVLVCTRLKLPVSTTHTIVGAIIGVGLARGLGAVDARVARDIFKSWFVTVPAAALLACLLFVAARALHLEDVIRAAFP